MSALRALLLLLFLAPAQAITQDRAPNHEAIRVMHRFGVCIARFPRYRTERVLALVPGTPEERRLIRTIAVTSQCLEQEGELSFRWQLLRGVIAEGLFESDFAALEGPPRRRPVVPFSNVTPEELAGMSEEGRRLLRALDFSQCVVAAAPAEVLALFATEPASAAEDAVFARIAPHLGPCLPQGAQMAIVKPQLRGQLAEAAYRAAYAASGRAR